MTEAFPFQKEGLRLLHEFGGRALLADEMGCLHPHVMIQCHKTQKCQTAEQWFLSSQRPFLWAYDMAGDLVSAQSTEFITKPAMLYLKVCLSDKSTIVGEDHLFLVMRGQQACLLKGKALTIGDQLATSMPGSMSGTPHTSLASTQSKRLIGLGLYLEMVLSTIREITSNSNLPWQAKTKAMFGSLRRTFNSLARQLSFLMIGRGVVSCTSSELSSVQSLPSMVCHLDSKHDENHQMYQMTSNITSVVDCLMQTVRSLGHKSRLLSFVMLLQQSCNSFLGSCLSEGFALPLSSGGMELINLGPVASTLPNAGVTGYMREQLASWQEKQRGSRMPGIGSQSISDPEGHVIPASFQNLCWQPVTSIERVGKGVVYDLSMPGLGNYFDAAGINHQNTGKSFQFLKYTQENPSRPVVVICPASLKLHWQRQALEHFGIETVVLYGTDGRDSPFGGKDGRWAMNHKGQRVDRSHIAGHDFYIVNYDILKSWVKFLRSLKPLIIGGDEAHLLGNLNSGRGRYTRELCEGVPHVIFMSGTPLTNRPWELYPLLYVLCPEVFDSPFTFGMEFCEASRTFGRWQFRGARNLVRLHAQLKQECMIRRTKADIGFQLPPRTRTIIPLELDAAGRKEYDHARTDLLGWLAEKYDLVRANRAARAEAYTKVTYLKRLVAQLKMPQVKQWLRDTFGGTDGKFLLGAIHRDIVAELAGIFPDQTVTIHGGKTSHQRQEAETAVRKDPNIRILVGQIKACGVGLNLPELNTVGVTEFPWTPGDLEQFEARPHRLNSTLPVNVYYFVTVDTIEVKFCKMLQQKMSILDQVLDGVPVRENSLTLYDALLEALLEEVRA